DPAEMARAETMEGVVETRGGGGGALPRHNTCRMGLVPQPPHTWPGPGAMHLQHHMHPLQALYLPHPQPEHQDEPQTLHRSPAESPVCNGGGGGGGAFSGQQPDSDREQLQDACSRQGPPPDLLPQNEHPSWASPRHRAPGAEAVLEVRRVANQLRVIGDEFNATILSRARADPPWQDWRDACRGLFNFISQTLSALYRLR
ncbi:hypothetical protein L3Q82_018468, partial [Scortum barcoo]